MTLLRSAPREVYRVYGEEEFWAHAEQELITPGGGAALDVADAPRRLCRRVLVSTLLLSAVGAVGALAITTRTPRASRGGAAASVRLLAAARSFVSVRGGRQRVSQTSHPATAQPIARSRAALVGRVLERARTLPPTSRTGPPAHPDASAAPDTRAAPETPAASRGAPATAQAAEAPGQPVATSPVETPPRARAAAAAPPAQPGQSEFGFER